MGHRPPGMLGLETALAVTLTELVEGGYLDLATAVERLTTGPARCRRLPGHGGPVAPGAPANLAVLDPAATWTVDRARLASRPATPPSTAVSLRGRAVHTLLRGGFTVRDGRATR